MLQHNEQLYLPTQRMYTLPDDRAYQQVKAAHLSTLHRDYANKSTFEKWALLIASMTDHFSAAHMPVITIEENHVQTTLQMTPALCTQRFNTFKTARENTSVSYYNLTLEQCVRYFEDLSFLFNTAHPQYRLRNAEKKSLIQSILEAMGECETGINGRFYSILQEFQKDSDWVSSELSKARCEALRQLGGSYTAQRGVSDALNIHVYDQMMKFAHELNLGIAQKEHILDVFAFLLNRRYMKSFFIQHHNRYFQAYERQADTTLATHILSEITNVIHIDANVWQENAVPISSLDIDAFGQAITNLFPGYAQTAVSYQFMQISDDGEMILLKSKAECMVEFRKLIRDKLVATGYYVDLNATAIQQTDGSSILKLQAGVSLERLHAFQNVLATQDLRTVNQQEGELLLRTYPEVLLHRIKQDLSVLKITKKWVTSTQLIDRLLAELDTLLCAALDANNSEEIENVTRSVIELIEPEFDYVAQLSPKILANLQVATMLLSKNGLLFGYLAPELQLLDSLRDIARTDNSLSAQYWDPSLIEVISIQQMKKAVSLQAFQTLSQSESINTSTFLALVRRLEPLQLKQAIKVRKQNGLSALPFCREAGVEKALERFGSAIQKLGNEWEEQGYLAIKKKACTRQIESPIEGDEIDYLAKTNDWFTGFMQFQHHRSSSNIMWQRLRLSFRSLLAALTSIVLILVAWYGAFLFIPPLFTFLSSICFEGFVVWGGLYILNLQLRNRWLATFNTVLWQLLLLDAILCQVLAQITWNLLKSLFSSASSFFGFVIFALDRLIHLCSSQLASKVRAGMPYAEYCDEVIGRLNFSEEPSALQKGAILKDIQGYMGAETRSENPALLHKKYPVVHQGRTYEVSFADVAKQRRLRADTFDLEPVSKTWCGLFTLRTSSEQLLPKVEEMALPDLVMA